MTFILSSPETVDAAESTIIQVEADTVKLTGFGITNVPNKPLRGVLKWAIGYVDTQDKFHRISEEQCILKEAAITAFLGAATQTGTMFANIERLAFLYLVNQGLIGEGALE